MTKEHGCLWLGFYGVGTYGKQLPYLFSADPFVVTPKDYGKVLLSWRRPGGNWSSIRLVRNSFGFPETETDGSILFTNTSDNPPTFWQDTGLRPGLFYYYSLFVLDESATPTGWARTGNVIGLVNNDWGYQSRLWELLPTFYRMEDAQFQTPAESKGPLERFVGLFGYYFDYIRTELETLRWTLDPGRVSGGVLPLLADQFGLTNETELGMARQRIQVSNIAHVYTEKGTKPGIENAVYIYTGWDSEAIIGHNLALDQNDSNFQQSLGRWVGVSWSTVSRRSPVVGDPDYDAGTPTSPNDAGYGVLRVNGTGSGNSTASFVTGSSAGTQGIPVTVGTTYIASIYARAETTPRQCGVQIDWYDDDNALLSSWYGSTLADSTSAWTRISVSGTAPAGAVRAGVTTFSIGVVLNEAHFFAEFQFERSMSATVAPTTFQTARNILVYTYGDRRNLCRNPSFEISTAEWTGVGNTLATSGAQSFDRTSSLAMTSTVLGVMYVQHTRLDGILAGSFLSASGYVRAATTPSTARAVLDWFNNNGTLLLTTDGDTVVETTTGWTRASVVSQAPTEGGVTSSLALYGVASNNVSTPAGGALNIAGDIDVRAKISPTTWTSPVSVSLVSRHGAVANYGWRFAMDGATVPVLTFAWSNDGTALTTATSSALPFTAGQIKHVRATLDVNNGSGGSDVRFFYSDDGVSWVQIGAVHTFGGVSSIYTGSTAPVRVGGNPDVAATDSFTGSFYNASVLNGVGGTIVASPDFTRLSDTAGNIFLDTQGNVWTINGSNWAVQTTAVTLTAVVRFVLDSVGIGDVHYLDGVLCENVPGVGEYFDGATFAVDALWGGTADLSDSYYYRRRQIKQARLVQLLEDYIPSGANVSVIVAQQAPSSPV